MVGYLVLLMRTRGSLRLAGSCAALLGILMRALSRIALALTAMLLFRGLTLLDKSISIVATFATADLAVEPARPATALILLLALEARRLATCILSATGRVRRETLSLMEAVARVMRRETLFCEASTYPLASGFLSSEAVRRAARSPSGARRLLTLT